MRSVRSNFSTNNSLTIASGDVVAPSALAVVASLSNQRLGVAVAIAGSLTTRLVHLMNAPIDGATPRPNSARTSLFLPSFPWIQRQEN
jgi:hypothetical protein